MTDPQRGAGGSLPVTIRAAAAVAVVCALALLVIHSVAQVALPGGGTSPQPGFDACALPCWAGITPGVTAFADVPDRVSAHTGGNITFRATGDRLLFEIGPGPQLSGAAYNDRGRVDSLRLESRFPLWRLIETLGTPRCALAGQVSGGQWRMTVYWDMAPGTQIAALAVLNTPDDWQPGTPTRTLLLLSGTETCRDTGARAWTGFAPLWRYS